MRSLREELLHSNQLRKQQLLELGQLREDEKQRMLRDHDEQVLPPSHVSNVVVDYAVVV